MGNCTKKPKPKGYDSDPGSFSSPSNASRRKHNQKSSGSDIGSDSGSTSRQAGRLLLKQPGYTDKFLEYHNQGHSIRRLIHQYKPPADWIDKLCQQYRLGNFQTTNSHGDIVYTRIIHMNDELDTTKRHFLAFYELDITQIYPPDFMRWCMQNQMYNTCSDYMSLYIVSRFQGPGSRILRTLSMDPHSAGIEMSDRFRLAIGWYRAIKFTSTTKQGVHWLFNAFMSRLDAKTYRAVRCDKDPYHYFEQDEFDDRSEFQL